MSPGPLALPAKVIAESRTSALPEASLESAPSAQPAACAAPPGAPLWMASLFSILAPGNSCAPSLASASRAASDAAPPDSVSLSPSREAANT